MNTGEIEIDGVRFIYKVNDFLKEINLFQPDNYQLVLSCQVEMEQLSFLHNGYPGCLLFSLAWFAFLTKEQPVFAQLAKA
jgi:hypothetical protein